MNPFPQILHAYELWAAAREAPATLALDVPHRVAWFLGFDLEVEIGPREAASWVRY